MVNFTTKNEYIKYFGRLEGEIVKVSETTIDNLIYARKIINDTRSLLKFGAGNQYCDIINTKGESFLRAHYAMAKGGDSIISHAKMCIQTQAANCSGHADVSYCLMNKNEVSLPVGRATSDVDDHAFVVIGDPRDSSHETVVVDAWASLATPFMLKNADKNIINENPTIKEWLPHRPQSIINESVTAIPLKEIEGFFKRLGVPPAGMKLCNYLMRDEKANSFVYDKLTTVRNPKVNYLSESTPKRFAGDEINESLYKSKMTGYKKSLKLRGDYGK
ncbi:hypothetical protein FNI11_12010 [Salmonella enterica subsp. salamae]|nr:hypothetical protein [Salmonella enterica subsp. salamae]ECJ2283576.1 hypothetical protein [Salmonella enterica subsp. salamae]